MRQNKYLFFVVVVILATSLSFTLRAQEEEAKGEDIQGEEIQGDSVPEEFPLIGDEEELLMGLFQLTEEEATTVIDKIKEIKKQKLPDDKSLSPDDEKIIQREIEENAEARTQEMIEEDVLGPREDISLE